MKIVLARAIFPIFIPKITSMTACVELSNPGHLSCCYRLSPAWQRLSFITDVRAISGLEIAWGLKQLQNNVSHIKANLLIYSVSKPQVGRQPDVIG